MPLWNKITFISQGLLVVSLKFLAPSTSVPLRLVSDAIVCVHLSLQISWKQFALKSQFSDESKKSHWFFFSVCSAFPSQKDCNENVRARNKSSFDLFLNDETILQFRHKAFLIMTYYYLVYCRTRFANTYLIKFAFIFTTDVFHGFLFM